MRKKQLLVNLLLAATLIVACEKQSDPTTSKSATNQKTTDGIGPVPPPVFVAWIRRDNIPSALTNFKGRFGAWSFVIGGKGYVGGGTAVNTNGSPSSGRNVYSYDTLIQSWAQQATPPSVVAGNEAAFAIGNYGYVLDGQDDTTQFNYQFNSLTNTWAPKRPMSSMCRFNATAVSAGGKAYIQGGAFIPSGVIFNSLLEYDPVADHWTYKAPFFGTATYGGSGFASPDSKAYFCGGKSGSDTYSKELWQYDPTTDHWTQKTNLPGSARAYAVGMTTTTAGFIATGYDGTNTLADVWKYNFATGTWGSDPNIPYNSPIVGLNGSREKGFGFGIGKTIYIGGGLSSDNDWNTARADFWSLAIPN